MKRVLVGVMAVPAGIMAIISVGDQLPPSILGTVVAGFTVTAISSVSIMLRHEDRRLQQELRFEEERLRINLFLELKNRDTRYLENYFETLLGREDLVVRIQRRDPSSSRVIPLDPRKRPR
jgi:hypothetical protein